MYVCHFFYDDEAMGTHVTLSQLDAAAFEFSFPLGDRPVNQPALSQTLVGHSIIVVRHCTVVLSGIYKAAPTGVPPAVDTDWRLAQSETPATV